VEKTWGFPGIPRIMRSMAEAEGERVCMSSSRERICHKKRPIDAQPMAFCSRINTMDQDISSMK